MLCRISEARVPLQPAATAAARAKSNAHAWRVRSSSGPLSFPRRRGVCPPPHPAPAALAPPRLRVAAHAWEGRRSMEEEVLTPDAAAAGLRDDDDDGSGGVGGAAAAPAAAALAVPVPTRTAAVRARDWALRSVVKIFVTRADPNYGLPWQKLPQRSSTGSGFVLDAERRLLLTNAHVVANATTVYVRRPGDPRKTPARVACVARQCDLALITVDGDDSFWEGLRALALVPDTPELQSPVLVAGYPTGGDSLCVTKGIVSRVCMTRYSQAGRLASLQVDSAINSGNSGGPAFADMRAGTVAGVAFSKNVGTGADNIGYVIEGSVVRHFLAEYEAHGTFRGLCSPGFYSQPLESPAQQAFYRVPPGAGGCLVVKVEKMGDVGRVLSPGDVVLALDGVPVAADETVPFRDDERLDYLHVFNQKHVGDTMAVRRLRDGRVEDVEYALARQHPLVGLLHGVDCQPSYFIAGGLVFAPLSLPVLEAAYGGRKWRTLAPVSVLSAFQQQREDEGQQVVVLVQVLSHEVNHGYKGFAMSPVETFNGAPIGNLAQLAAAVDACADAYMTFALDGGRSITLEAAAVRAAGRDVLRVHAIAADRSDDLLAPPPPPPGAESGGAAVASVNAVAAAGDGAELLPGVTLPPPVPPPQQQPSSPPASAGQALAAATVVDGNGSGSGTAPASPSNAT